MTKSLIIMTISIIYFINLKQFTKRNLFTFSDNVTLLEYNIFDKKIIYLLFIAIHYLDMIKNWLELHVFQDVNIWGAYNVREKGVDVFNEANPIEPRVLSGEVHICNHSHDSCRLLTIIDCLFHSNGDK